MQKIIFNVYFDYFLNIVSVHLFTVYFLYIIHMYPTRLPLSNL